MLTRMSVWCGTWKTISMGNGKGELARAEKEVKKRPKEGENESGIGRKFKITE